VLRAGPVLKKRHLVISNTRPTINWSKGFWRLWLVASIMWIVGVGWIAWPWYSWNERAIGWWLTYTFVPTALTLIVGASLAWALRGFLQKRP